MSESTSPPEGSITFDLDRADVTRLFLWGLLVWASVVVLIRAVGHLLLSPSAPGIVAGFFVVTVPLMLAVTYPVYWRFDITASSRPAAAAVMSIPGMLLDVGLLLNVHAVFPRLEPGSAINFGAILLFGYAVVLLTGVGAGQR